VEIAEGRALRRTRPSGDVPSPVVTLLALQHISCEPPAAFEDELRSRGLDMARVELDDGDPLPDWRDFEGLIVMGGPMGAYEEDAHPWLAGEKRAIGDAARAGHPVWGVCLGAQLLAGALGARVYTGPEAEVGLLDVELTPAAADDPVFRDAPPSFPTLQWHGDTFDLPQGSTLLASSPAYRSQAFVYQRASGSSSTWRSRPPWRRNGATCPPTPRASRHSAGRAPSTASWAR
jgi:GMP synthase (glutamine-hydrolysing)